MTNLAVRKMVWFTTFSILFLLFVLPGIMATLIRMIPANDQPGYGSLGRVSVYGLRNFTQKFISKEKNMTAIGTTIKNPNLKNNKDIMLKLYDGNGNLVRTSVLNGFNIGDGDFVKFIFEPIPDSSQKEYSFVLSSPLAGEGQIIELFLTGKTNEILEYIYDDETRTGGAPIVTFHKPDSRLETVKLIYLNLFTKL